jgi:hypothetical protein
MPQCQGCRETVSIVVRTDEGPTRMNYCEVCGAITSLAPVD